MGAAESVVQPRRVPDAVEAECALHGLPVTTFSGDNKPGALLLARVTADDVGPGYNRWRFIVTYTLNQPRKSAAVETYASDAVYEDRPRALYAGVAQLMTVSQQQNLAFALRERRETPDGHPIWLEFASSSGGGKMAASAYSPAYIAAAVRIRMAEQLHGSDE